ncbi:MAG: chemotaxis protein CheD [Bacillota bacterium]|nr:chemotaxis protein CheD [Bacillota bacterium]MDK2881714.1 chemotaxis protein CheD [Bacillota bacterium]MDK2959835.1 chemotaxis protein CheD [Bacillota bacterium]
MGEVRRVGMADLAVGKEPVVLVTIGLGSCVGVALYDDQTKVGGLAHIMLPEANGLAVTNPAKFADTALPLLVKKMEELGANPRRLTAKIAGGAQMFRLAQPTEMMRIGERNTEAVLNWLRAAGIRVVAQDTGGSWGRTIELDTSTGELRVKTIAHGEKRL